MKIKEYSFDVPKFQSGGGIGDMKVTVDNFYDINNPDFISVWKNLANNPNITLDEMNQFIQSHYNLYSGSGYNGTKAIPYKGTNDYQKKYHNTYGFGNTDNFWKFEKNYDRQSLYEHGDANVTDQRPESGQQFSGDNNYGNITHHRRSTFFNPQELAQANAAVKNRGWEFVRAPFQYSDDPTRSAYILREIQGDDSKNPPEDQTNKKRITRFKLNPYGNPPKDPMWTDWAPLSAQLANDLYTIRVNNALQKKLKFPLQEFPRYNHALSSDYLSQQTLKQNAANVRAFRTQHLTSDLNKDMELLSQGEKDAIQYNLEALKRQASQYHADRLQTEKVENQNMANEVQTANYNRQQNVASFNNIINADMQRNLRKLQTLNNYIGNMYISHGQWLQTGRLNQDNWQRLINSAQASNILNAAYKTYSQNVDNPQSWDGLKAFYEAAVSGTEEGLPVGNPDFTKASPEEIQAVLEWLQTSDNQLAKNYRKAWENQQKKWANDYEDASNQAYTQLQLDNAGIPLYRTNQGFFRTPVNSNRVSPIFEKGGKFDKLSNFTRQVTKEQQEVRKESLQRAKMSLQHLDKELDRLNREQLILLRQAFK